ncbi:MAG: hypothetical protein HYZ50_05315 [Deltaproteobacteria bacterium]|nr:hypothetical protein [Deltaproteobacteria bacterium]
MAETVQQEEQSMEKAIWGLVGTAVLWISLLFSGIALERLGLTSRILSGVLPGETGMLRTQAADLKDKLTTTERSYDEMMRTKQALEVEVSRLKKTVAAAPQ